MNALSKAPSTLKLLLFSSQSTRRLALFLVIAAIISSIVTYSVITGSSNPLGPDPRTVITLVTINLLLLVILGGMVARRGYALWSALQHGSVGSRLQQRILLTFAAVTIIPTAIVAVFSALFFHFGIQSWFDIRVSTALEESVIVAEAYLEEHKETLRADALAMAGDIKKELPLAFSNPQIFNSILTNQTTLRNLTDAIVFLPNRVIGRSELSFSLAFEQMPPELLAAADQQQIVMLSDADDDKIKALIKLDAFNNIYLLIGRFIDARVVRHVSTSQGAAKEYRALREDISNIQWQFSIVFVLVALLLLLAAMWYGMVLAMRLVTPITDLIGAADRVKAGDYAIRVSENRDDEMGALSRSFNRMTEQLGKQRDELMAANRVIDERRRFTETVFSGVSSAVLALDKNRNVSICNRSAARLLGYETRQSLNGLSVDAILPEISSLIDNAAALTTSLAQKQIQFTKGDQTLSLHIRIAVEQFNEKIEGFIITIDDITPLESAQRSAAWADVARRIAHEIKNPLTPITLSAERLKRKFADEIDDKENYLRYVDTISRNVQDIGTMVEEFVSFARMPKPKLAEHDMVTLINRVIFAEKTVNDSAITYHFECAHDHFSLVCDATHLQRVFTNILKNAAESIAARKQQQEDNGETVENGTISILFGSTDDLVIIQIEDNGLGFPEDKLQTLTEPYVTTRAKGTGLGLAIVKKHMEEHGGSIELQNRPVGGAKVILAFCRTNDVNTQQ